TTERRKILAGIGSKYDVLILEDDPYRDLRYSGEELPPIKAFDQTGHTILANSFSKIFSPGARLGYVLAEHVIIERLLDAKTATN
ncbi:aminotransferase class I/II-fold pyridoxal phosphate-dependent enzyme, partial [Clostridioides difficile]